MAEETATPVPPPPPSPPPASASTKTGMLVLSYLGLLAIIPLLVEKNDREVQWHAKHGLVLFGAYFILAFAVAVTSFVMAPLAMLQIPLWLGYLIVAILGIVKAVGGQRLLIPGVSDYANKF